jgi:hypothetical protein
MCNQCVIDWWKNQAYEITTLSDNSTMCVSEAAKLQMDIQQFLDAMSRVHAAKWDIRR